MAEQEFACYYFALAAIHEREHRAGNQQSDRENCDPEPVHVGHRPVHAELERMRQEDSLCRIVVEMGGRAAESRWHNRGRRRCRRPRRRLRDPRIARPPTATSQAIAPPPAALPPDRESPDRVDPQAQSTECEYADGQAADRDQADRDSTDTDYSQAAAAHGDEPAGRRADGQDDPPRIVADRNPAAGDLRRLAFRIRADRMSAGSLTLTSMSGSPNRKARLVKTRPRYRDATASKPVRIAAGFGSAVGPAFSRMRFTHRARRIDSMRIYGLE